VEVQAEGGEMALNELFVWCECGPSAATVKRVLFSKMPVTGNDWFLRSDLTGTRKQQFAASQINS
jgi:hypothetical protein